MEDRRSMQQWWPVAFLFGFLALVAILVIIVARPAGQPAEPVAEHAAEASGAALSAAEFAELLTQRQPRYAMVEIPCPVDDTMLSVPRQTQGNALGGVATDLMGITLGPPEGGMGRPSMQQQDWEMLLVTCPDCRVTCHGIDLANYGRSDKYDLSAWDLAALAPALALRPSDEWTVDERILVRLLTQRAAGVESVELGFTALQGAYAANFNTWYGREVRIPSAAFYALAGAYFKDALANDPTLSGVSRSVTEMTQGEVYRLLGRMEDAAQAFAAARALSGLDENALQVIEQVEAQVSAADSTLHRAEVKGLAPLSTGWYLDEMLPAMNGHIAEHRGAWAALDDPAEILDLVLSELPAH